MNKNYVRLLKITVIVFFIFYNQVVEAKFINTFLVRYGAASLTNASALAKYDIIFPHENHWNDLKGAAFTEIKAINPNVKIYPYYMITITDANENCEKQPHPHTPGRYDKNATKLCNHRLGDIKNDNPNFHLVDSKGYKLQWSFSESNIHYWLDFGDDSTDGYQHWVTEAIIADKYGKAWQVGADGIFADYLWAVKAGTRNWDLLTSPYPTLYPTDAAWATAMNDFIKNVGGALSIYNIEIAGNRGPLGYASTHIVAIEAWKSQDQSAYPMAAAMQEGCITQKYISGKDVYWWNETLWRDTIDLMGDLENTKFCCLFSVKHSTMDYVGIDNLDQKVTGWEALWYSIGSYLLGKNDTYNTTYFEFIYGDAAYDQDSKFWFDEYDKIDLGNAVGNYNVVPKERNNIYWREFEKGYVYVNPTNNNVTNILLPQICKQRTHENLYEPLTGLKEISSIDLDAHRAAILYKVKINIGKAPNAPKNLVVIK